MGKFAFFGFRDGQGLNLVAYRQMGDQWLDRRLGVIGTLGGTAPGRDGLFGIAR